ncbi:mRNA capping enzyme, catalytic domain-containing protein, partial [Circinella umbellata]
MAAFNPQHQQQQQHHQQQSYNNNSSTSISSSSSNSSTSDHPLSTRTSPRSHINSNNETSMLPETIGKRVHPQHSQVLHGRVKELLNFHHDSFPGSQPISFERKHLTELEQEDYFVCEKTDGVRYLLFFLHSSKGPASFLFDRNRNWYHVPNLLFPMRGREKECLKDTLMDGELIMDTEPNNNDKKIWRFLIFDLMSLNGVPVTKRSFNTRLGLLQQDVIAPFKNSIRHLSDSVKSPPFSIELKKMERSYGLHLVFDQMTKLKHSSDGVIWTPVKHPYIPGTCDKLLKWKPPELNTVDFRISAKWSKEHKPIYKLEVLSHGVTYKFYDHFQPESELAAEWKNHLPDGRIAEFRYDRECAVTIVEQGYAPTTRKGGWRFVRFRGDKDTANDENVVRKIVRSIEQGITKEELLQHMDKVRSAWKAREKGLPIPTSSSKPTPEHLTLTTITTTCRPAIASLNTSLTTPTSATTPAILPSPSVTNMGSSYFPPNYDYVIKSRNNSIDMGRVSDTNSRRQSVPDMSSLSTTATKGVFLKHEPMLQQVDENDEENENHDDNGKEEGEDVNKRKREHKEKVIEPVSSSSVIDEDIKSVAENERKLSTDSNGGNAGASLSEDGQSSNKRDSPRMSTGSMERKRFKSWAGEWTNPEEKRPSVVATPVFDDSSHQYTVSTVPQ